MEDKEQKLREEFKMWHYNYQTSGSNPKSDRIFDWFIDNMKPQKQQESDAELTSLKFDLKCSRQDVENLKETIKLILAKSNDIEQKYGELLKSSK